MMTKKISVTTTMLLSVLTVVLFQISGKTSEVWAAEGAGQARESGSATAWSRCRPAEWCDRRVAACLGGTYRRSGFALCGPCDPGGSCTASRPQARR